MDGAAVAAVGRAGRKRFLLLGSWDGLSFQHMDALLGPGRAIVSTLLTARVEPAVWEAGEARVPVLPQVPEVFREPLGSQLCAQHTPEAKHSPVHVLRPVP